MLGMLGMPVFQELTILALSSKLGLAGGGVVHTHTHHTHPHSGLPGEGGKSSNQNRSLGVKLGSKLDSHFNEP